MQRRASTGGARHLPLSFDNIATAPPAPASVPRPPKLSLGCTLLPQDSLPRGKRLASDDKTRTAKLFAAAGLDLFRESLAFDAVAPRRQEPRHPAVSPNLGPIPEDDDAAPVGVSSASQAILVLGAGPLSARGEVNTSVAHRVESASRLYWQVTRAYAERQANSHCYLIPVADELGKDGVLECEAMRNALAAAGISPHHIIMNCSAPSVIENIERLVPVLRHLHTEHVHVVVSALCLPRVQRCVDRILCAADDMRFKTQYHVAPDGLEPRERALWEKIEARRLKDASRPHGELDDAVARLAKQQRRLDATRGATHSSAGASSPA
ncbi:hypothetical protein PybrP1_008943 [[Pythium] brassicae (nom. inval.)]|nr:hypothetical protein PybrP1_008943 [[Pythium] brassicae (nom. inval.)]